MITIVPQGMLLQAALDAHFITQLVLFLACILGGALLVGKILYYVFRLPVIAGQIIGGILLGPTGINIADWFLFGVKTSDCGSATCYTFITADLALFFLLAVSAVLTVPSLLWLAGHETDIRELIGVGLTAFIAGFLGAVLPIIGIGSLLYFCFSSAWNLSQSIGMGLVFSATSVSISVALLLSYGKMHTRSAKVTLGAAVIDDIIAVIFLSLFMIMGSSGFFGPELANLSHDGESASLLAAIVRVFGVLFLLVFVGYFMVRPFVFWIEKKKLYYLMAPVATGVMFLFFVLSELVGHLAGITGAYFAGLFHRMGDVHHRAEKVISPFVQMVLLPFFLGSIGLQVNMRILTMHDLFMIGLILIIAIVTKYMGCIAAMIMNNRCGHNQKMWEWVEMKLFGASMIARGEVGLVVASLLFGAHIFSLQQYIIAIVGVVLTTVVTPLLLVPALHQVAK